MKLEVIAGSAKGGMALASGSFLAQFGTTWEVAAMALAGATLAVLELEVHSLRTVVSMLVFNFLVGTLAAPFVVDELGVSHKSALVLIAFGMGYAGHDLFMAIRVAVKARIEKRIGGAK